MRLIRTLLIRRGNLKTLKSIIIDPNVKLPF